MERVDSQIGKSALHGRVGRVGAGCRQPRLEVQSGSRLASGEVGFGWLAVFDLQKTLVSRYSAKLCGTIGSELGFPEGVKSLQVLARWVAIVGCRRSMNAKSARRRLEHPRRVRSPERILRLSAVFIIHGAWGSGETPRVWGSFGGEWNSATPRG